MKFQKTIRTALLIAWCSWLLAAQGQSNGVFNILNYGAVGDGKTLATKAINGAIEECSRAGGGQVLFPPGRYLSGSVHLKSGITLYLPPGAVLAGTTNLDFYQSFTPPGDTPEGKFRPSWHRSLILGVEVTNVTITGGGTIDGAKVFDPRGEERMRGPHTILTGHSTNIVIKDLHIIDSANYAILMEDTSNVDIENVKFTGGWDGVHFRGWPGRPCRNFRIVGCQFYTGDDSIAGRYWENVLIANCIINSSCNGIRLIGPALQFIVQDCLFYGPGLQPHRSSNRSNMLAAINLQPGAWDPTEGLMDQVILSDLTMHNVATPFHMNLKKGNQAGRVKVNRVSATGVYRSAFSVESWSETPFTNVVFRDITVEFDGGATNTPPLEIKAPGTDPRRLPVWGFYARNVQELIMENVRIRLEKNDARPAMFLENIGEFRHHQVLPDHVENNWIQTKNVNRIEPAISK